MEKEPTAWAGLSTCPLHSWASTSFRCVLNAFPLKLSICQVKKWAPVLASQWGGLWAADSASLGGSARRYGFLVSTYPLQGCLLVCVCVCVCALSCVCMCSLDCSPDVTPHHTHTHTPLPFRICSSPPPSIVVRPASSGSPWPGPSPPSVGLGVWGD